MTDRLTNSLTAIAEDLRRAKDACEQAERDAIDHAMNAGRMLCEAKEQCPHGQWLPFLKRADVSERKAQRWMRLHRGRLNSDTVSLLGGVTPALTFLGLRDKAMRCLDAAEKHAIEFETTGEENAELLRSMDVAISYIEAMACCFPAEETAAPHSGGAGQ